MISRERRVAIKSRIRELTNKYSSSPASQKKEITSAISKLYNNANRIFLSTHRNSLKISSTTIRNMNLLLKNFTQKHSITLSNSIHTHMFRRTYAVLIVNFNSHSILTSTLRDHFKHSSILMTSSYTSLNGLDHELLKFIEKEEVNFKHAVISEWLDPKTKISGKSGDSFKSYRDKLPPILLSNFKEAVKLIASTTSIRSTGHAWCLSGKSDCSGQGGIYDLSHCATDCSYGLVDKNYIPHYESIYEQQIKLLELDDIGEGGRSKIKQEALRVIKILNNLKGL
ncbi:hypothetical protein [Pseudomonas sp.]|uniref:hypothetical protein n=1 Tax=Pseudomonas sp. TaxID=306 RepID=UPI0028A95C54|nr:hypothetical protein [Pseudomonas sp.]